MKIKELIVVEGKSDTKRLKTFFEVETIETSGSHLGKEVLEFIRVVNEKRGVILLLDPDYPGENVRRRINEAIPGLKNAFVFKKDARTSKKVGIEHASKEVLEEALKNVVTYEEESVTLTTNDLMELGLTGQNDAQAKRDLVASYYHIGQCNTKSFLKRLNMLKVTKKNLKEILNKV